MRVDRLLDEVEPGLGVDKIRLEDGRSGKRACATSDRPSSATREMLRWSTVVSSGWGNLWGVFVRSDSRGTS